MLLKCTRLSERPFEQKLTVICLLVLSMNLVSRLVQQGTVLLENRGPPFLFLDTWSTVPMDHTSIAVVPSLVRGECSAINVQVPERFKFNRERIRQNAGGHREAFEQGMTPFCSNLRPSGVRNAFRARAKVPCSSYWSDTSIRYILFRGYR